MKHLLKKELSELLSKQMLIGLAVSFLVMVVIGLAMSMALSSELSSSGTVRIIDSDRTDFTARIVSSLEEKGYTVETGTDFEQEAAEHDWTEAVGFPAGMTEALLEQHQSTTLTSFSVLRSTSTMTLTMSSATSTDAASQAIRELLYTELLSEDQAFLSDPIDLAPITYANGRSAEADPATIVSTVAMFDTFMPLVLFLLVVLTSQTIIGAIAAEKTDKTLEALLSAPVPRSKIIGAKMLAALIVAVIYAATYALGFIIAMLATVGSAADSMDVGSAFTSLVSARQAVQTLGLEIPFWGWCGVALQLLLTLGIALTASIILGGLVEDAKGSQTASMPILLCTMFPYILTMVSDIRSMETGTRMLLYAVPFTHTFIATGCLRFHDYLTFWGGAAYQAVFLAGMAFFALRLFSSDMLFVHSGRRRRKKQSAEEQV